jgi:hypothetical protein
VEQWGDEKSNWIVDDIIFQWYIEQLIAQNAVNTTLETYMPDVWITRAEFLKILLNVKKIDYRSTVTQRDTFSDLNADDWVSKVAYTAFDLGMADGYDDGTFRPNAVISRIEALKLIIKVAWVKLEETDSTEFIDVEIEWMKKYVNYAFEKSIITGQLTDIWLIYRPQESITRGESAKIVINGSYILEQEISQ